jgi:hypothetical protein
LQLIQFALGFVGLAAEAYGAAPQAEDFFQRQVRLGGMGQGFQAVKAKADDLGGEGEFLLGFDAVSGDHVGGGLAGERLVAGGGDHEELCQMEEDGLEDGVGDGGGLGHGASGRGAMFGY